MKAISVLKERLGQDLPYVEDRIEELNDELNRLLLHPEENAEEITYIRGKLLNRMKQRIDLLPPDEIGPAKTLLNFEIGRHKQQLSSRIRSNQRSDNHNLSNEIALKIRRTANSYNQIVLSNNRADLANNIVNSLGNTVSTIGSVAKVPLVGAARLLESQSNIFSRVITAPLHVPAYLFSKLIKPNSPYKGKMVGTINNALEKVIAGILENTEDVIRRG